MNSLTAPPNSRLEALEEKLPEYCKRLRQPGMTTLKVHQEYLADYPDGYSISQFRANIRRYLQLSKAMMHVEHNRRQAERRAELVRALPRREGGRPKVNFGRR